MTTVLLTHVLNASWVSGSAYAFLSEVTNDTASRDYSTELPFFTNPVNEFELVVKYLKLSLKVSVSRYLTHLWVWSSLLSLE